MDVEETLLWLVFRRLDSKSLAAACVVSREWLKAARDEDLWKHLSCEKWPSLATDGGRRVLESFGGSYREFYAQRSKAARFRSHPPPDLQVYDLNVLLDIQFNGDTIASVIRRGDEMKPIHSCEGSMFRFSLDITDADRQRIPALVKVSSLDPRTGTSQGSPGEAVDSHGPPVRKLRRSEIKNFDVSWAIMVQGSSKIVQVLQTRGGTFLDNVCSFSGRLPRIAGYPVTASNLMAEVDLVFESTRDPRASNSRTFLRYSTFKEIRVSMINADSWRYISHEEALGYLQHLLQHHD